MSDLEWIGIGCAVMIGLGLFLVMTGRDRGERLTGWLAIAPGVILLICVVHDMLFCW
jgi:hypothetical protein